VHTSLAQSLPLTQPWPGPHRAHVLPPQSVPVSLPFFTPSVQLGATHLFAVHTWLEQSELPLQPCPVPQVGHDPPQSVPVSEPFFTVSVQVGARHVPLVHTPLEQSLAPPHVEPSAHGLPGHAAPQSRPPSLPFFTPSLHVGAWQT
jgi:hypothetical protein